MIEDKGAAQVIANRINKLIDEKGIKPGERSKFAEKYHNKEITPETVRLAAEHSKTLEELNLDSLTGLFSERKFVQDGIEALQEAIVLQDDGEIIADRDKLKNLFIARSDIGFLGYANTLPGGHDISGDTYKIALAQLESCKTERMRIFARENKFKVTGYVLTKGDESALIFRGNTQQKDAFASQIQAEVQQMKIGVEGDNPKLPASLNVEFVSAEEYLDDFTRFTKDREFTSDKFYEQYLFFISSIADFKADVQKINERLAILLNMTREWKKTSMALGTYDHLRAHILKGAAEVSETDLYDMSNNDSASIEEFKINAKAWVTANLKRRLDHALKTGLNMGTRPIGVLLLQVKRNLLDTY